MSAASWLGEYRIEFIIQAGHRLAFSEDAAFLEILLVARKKGRGTRDQPCVAAFLGIKPTDSNSRRIGRLLERNPVGRRGYRGD